MFTKQEENIIRKQKMNVRKEKSKNNNISTYSLKPS